MSEPSPIFRRPPPGVPVHPVLWAMVGIMVAVQSDRMVSVPLAEACEEIKGVDDDLYELAATFFS